MGNIFDHLNDGQVYGVVSSESAPPRGSSKTSIALKLAIDQAEMLGYGLCFNFDINSDRLLWYLKKMGYWKLIQQFKQGRILVRPTIDKFGGVCLHEFIKPEEKKIIYVLDEMEVYANSQKWQSMPAEFRRTVTQCRHRRIRIWWIAQVYKNIDSQLKSQTDYILEANSLLKKSSSLEGAAEILMKQHWLFRRNKYDILNGKKDSWGEFKMMWKKRSLSECRLFGMIDKQDKALFKIYDSFDDSFNGGLPKMHNPPCFKKSGQIVSWNDSLIGDIKINEALNKTYRKTPLAFIEDSDIEKELG